MPTQNGWNNQVTGAPVTFTGGITSIGTDAAANNINIGTGGAAKTITVGNVTGATAVNVNTGSGGTTYTTTNGAFALNTGTGNITLGNDAAAKTVTLGNTNTTSTTAIKCGTGGFTLASVTGNLISATSTGPINYPLQPAFFAYKSSSTTNATGDGTTVTVIMDTKPYDQNSNYNSSTGVFTAPITGKYFFVFAVELSVLGSSTGAEQFINTSVRRLSANYGNWAQSASSATKACTCSAFVDMSISDTCSFQVYATGTSKSVTVFGSANYPTYAAGYLVC